MAERWQNDGRPARNRTEECGGPSQSTGLPLRPHLWSTERQNVPIFGKVGKGGRELACSESHSPGTERPVRAERCSRRRREARRRSRRSIARRAPSSGDRAADSRSRLVTSVMYSSALRSARGSFIAPRWTTRARVMREEERRDTSMPRVSRDGEDAMRRAIVRATSDES